MNILFFDIETVYDENHEQDLDNLIERFWDKTDFMPEINQVLTICCWTIREDWSYYINNIKWTEKEQIEQFFQLIQKYSHLCWFNILNFDLPFIIKRALCYWIKIPDKLKFYWKAPRDLKHIIDLQEAYKMNVWWWIWNLDLISHHLWIESPKEKMSWKEVQVYHDTERDKEIIEYCKKDVLATIQVYQKFLEFNLI